MFSQTIWSRPPQNAVNTRMNRCWKNGHGHCLLMQMWVSPASSASPFTVHLSINANGNSSFTSDRSYSTIFIALSNQTVSPFIVFTYSIYVSKVSYQANINLLPDEIVSAVQLIVLGWEAFKLISLSIWGESKQHL